MNAEKPLTVYVEFDTIRSGSCADSRTRSRAIGERFTRILRGGGGRKTRDHFERISARGVNENK